MKLGTLEVDEERVVRMAWQESHTPPAARRAKLINALKKAQQSLQACQQALRRNANKDMQGELQTQCMRCFADIARLHQEVLSLLAESVM